MNQNHAYRIASVRSEPPFLSTSRGRSVLTEFLACWQRFNYSLRQFEVRFARTGDSHRLGLLLHGFVPGNNVVFSIRHVVDLVVAGGIRLSKIWRRTDYDKARHFCMDVAKQRRHTRLLELVGPLLPLRPGPDVMSCLLIAADRRPKHVVLLIVVVDELDGRPLLHDQDVGDKRQVLLAHDGLLRRRRKCLAGYRVYIDHGLSWRHLSLDRPGSGGSGYHCYG